MVLGGPGCGKGTQCERLASELGLCQVTMGDLLRREVAKGSVLGERVNRIISGGNVVPGEMAMLVLREELEVLKGGGYMGVLLDGFPRNLEQMLSYDKEIGEYEFALFFDCETYVSSIV